MEHPIVALATPPGTSAIAVLRLSGKNCIALFNQVFRGKDLTQVPSHTAHLGTIHDGERIIDEVLVTVFRAPRSFTKEDSLEVSTHGSPYIVQETIQLLVRQGITYAKAGEFTQRAFLNGRFDLAQAEAVADLIASESAAEHAIALRQMRGGFSEQLQTLRQDLLDFCALIELELDFGEEDVQFANRDELRRRIGDAQRFVAKLLDSFAWGNAIKTGVPTVIVGKPNAGKSTLLNALLNEEKAIVSDIPGTTRDVIEDQLTIGGIRFRFMDTAGLRETKDRIEQIGVARTQAQMKKAALILYLFDAQTFTAIDAKQVVQELQALDVPFLMIANQIDRTAHQVPEALRAFVDIGISALQRRHLEELQALLLRTVARGDTGSQEPITNLRHYEALQSALAALQAVDRGLDRGDTSDFLALDLRDALYHLGVITGQVTNDEVLGSIFSKFCIGK
ncbi:MAG: tRNA uridine-5-carboxymethylaminomethyl(34) synthesis GTPase MnmE [Bernardetiaceae bacterium]